MADAMAERARRVAEQRAAALDREDQELAAKVAAVRTERMQQAALAKHPGLAPLIDLIAAEDADGYAQAADELAAAMGLETANAAPAPPPEVPVSAGNPALRHETAADRLDAIKAEARASGEWSAYFRAKEEIAAREAGYIQ
jgi:hypothetical protein